MPDLNANDLDAARRSSPAPPARWAWTWRADGRQARQAIPRGFREDRPQPALPARRGDRACSRRPRGAKFDETVELHIRLGVNVRHAEEQLRGTLALPHGLGKDVTVAVFAEGDAAREAEEAGADYVGAQDLADGSRRAGPTSTSPSRRRP